MRHFPSEKLEPFRITHGKYASPFRARYGAFEGVPGPSGRALVIISTDGQDEDGKQHGSWEHVSVSIAGKHPPNWQEMCFVKDLFWGEEECVVQFHPPKSEYISYHPNCLHLWRCTSADFPRPPAILVGPKGSRETKE